MAKKKAFKKSEAEDLEDYLKKIPKPPEEHREELEMERHLKKIIKLNLTEKELRFYSRQLMLDEMGLDGQLKLKGAKVCIVGLGGLGSIITMQLATLGVGELKLVDRDIVDESNLQRQHLYNYDVIGYPKVEAAVMRLKKANPYIKYKPIPLSINEENISEIIREVDVVVDGLDNMKARYNVNRACVNLKIPYIFGAAISTYGNTSTIIPDETACLECFYGKLDDKDLPSCATIGIHLSVLGIIASIEVAETIKLLTKKEPSLKNKLLYCDIGSLRFEEIKIARSKKCPVCGSQPKKQLERAKGLIVEESCGRNNKKVFIIQPDGNITLDLKDLAVSLQKDVELKVKSEFGLTVVKDDRRISILKSGIMIIEGMQSREDALKFYTGTLKKI